MGARYDPRFVRHGGNRGASLVGRSDSGLFDGHPDQSIRILDIRRRRIGRRVCGYYRRYACALRKE